MSRLDGLEGLSRFGKFIIRKKLGTGGMAEVYLAEATGPDGFGKLVALKRILPYLTTSREFIESLISEARLGGSLNHPNIVQTLELGCEGDYYYLVMEYVEGITLSAFLRYRLYKQAPLPLQLVLDITKQLCDGLDYAHTATDMRGSPLRMVHRDLKTSNVMLSTYGSVKISDFGVSKATSNMVETASFAMVKGTVAYMSPEQARADPLDHRSDLYSLGAILFELLTFERLYPRASGLPGLYQVERGEVEDRLKLLADYPPSLVNILARLLARDREDRYDSAWKVRQELVAVAATQPACLMDLRELVRDALRDEIFQSLEVMPRPSSSELPLSGDEHVSLSLKPEAGQSIPSPGDARPARSSPEPHSVPSMVNLASAKPRQTPPAEHDESVTESFRVAKRSSSSLPAVERTDEWEFRDVGNANDDSMATIVATWSKDDAGRERTDELPSVKTEEAPVHHESSYSDQTDALTQAFASLWKDAFNDDETGVLVPPDDEPTRISRPVFDHFGPERGMATNLAEPFERTAVSEPAPVPAIQSPGGVEQERSSEILLLEPDSLGPERETASTAGPEARRRPSKTERAETQRENGSIEKKGIQPAANGVLSLAGRDTSPAGGGTPETRDHPPEIANPAAWTGTWFSSGFAREESSNTWLYVATAIAALVVLLATLLPLFRQTTGEPEGQAAPAVKKLAVSPESNDSPRDGTATTPGTAQPGSGSPEGGALRMPAEQRSEPGSPIAGATPTTNTAADTVSDPAAETVSDPVVEPAAETTARSTPVTSQEAASEPAEPSPAARSDVGP